MKEWSFFVTWYHQQRKIWSYLMWKWITASVTDEGIKNCLLIIKHYTPQVTKGGKIIDEKTYRLNMAKKEHRKHVRDLLATAIVHKTLDVEVRICIYVYVALSLVFVFFFYPLTLRVKQWCSVVLRYVALTLESPNEILHVWWRKMKPLQQ